MGRLLPTSGILEKWTNYIHGYQERYFEIENGTLMYYKSKGDKHAGCRGSFSLRSSKITPHEFNEDEFQIQISPDSIWYLKAQNAEARALWMKALTGYHDSGYSSSSTFSHSRNPSVSSVSIHSTDSRLPNKEQDAFQVDSVDGSIESKVSELEGYKSLCNEQLNTLERILEGAGPTVQQTNLLAFKATHLAMMKTLSDVITLVRRGDSVSTKLASSAMLTPDSPVAESGSEKSFSVRKLHFDPPPSYSPIQDTNVTSDCEDEFHDADDHSIDQAREALEADSRASSVEPAVRPAQEALPPANQSVEIKRHLPFGNFDKLHLSDSHPLYSEIEEITMQQLRYALEGVEQNTWTLFAEDGEMKMFKREVEMDGLPVDPLKAIHNVKGVSALEYMHHFFDPKYKTGWDHTLDGMKVVEHCAPDTAVLHQKHKTVWPAASRESLFWSHIRRVDELKNADAADLYVVCNKDIVREDVPLGSSSAVRVKLTVSMVCETIILNGKHPSECTRDDVSCRILYVSCVHPGGWVPTAALRQVYKREYPKFLRTFTEYVMKNVKGKPLAM